MKQLLVLLLGLSFAPLLPAAELDLSIPNSPVESKKIMGEDAPCKGCGVVTNVRQLAPAANQTPPPPDSPYLITFAEANREPEGGVDTAGTSIKTWDEWPEGVWQTTVRLDDGSYTAHESKTRPSFQEGDRVQVISGKLVPQ
jgi:hypothetical protein